MDNFINQILKNNFQTCVEIVVSDNASTDGTLNLLKQYQSQYPEFFRYNHNETNLGFYGNVKKLIEIASNKYIWLCSDDDYPEENSLFNIIHVLSKNDVDNMILNFRHSQGINLGLKEDRLVSISEALEYTKLHTTAMTCNIYKTETIKNVQEVHTTFYSFDVLMNYPHKAKTYITSFLGFNCSTDEEAMNQEGTWKNNKNLFLYSVELYDTILNSTAKTSVRKTILKEHRKHFCQVIFEAKRTNALSKNEYKEQACLLKEYMSKDKDKVHNFIDYLIVYLILFVDNPILLKILKKIAKMCIL